MPNQAKLPKRKLSAPAEDVEKRPRTRVSRACDQCRTAREKCDGIQPVCYTCQASDRTCSYTANPKKRGIQPGYIRTLELALSWLFSNLPESEPSLTKLLAQGGASSVLLGKDANQSNKLHKKWRRSRFCKDIDKYLSGTMGGAQDLKSTDSDDEETDAEDFAHVLEDAYTHQSAFHFPATAEVVQLADRSQPILNELSPSGKIKLPTQFWHLIDVYFTHVQCWLPISEKPDVLRISYSYTDGLELSPTMAQSGDHAEMWSILALAALLSPTETEGTNTTTSDELHTPEWLYAVARRLVPSEQGAFELGHAKALLNLAQVNLFHRLPEAAVLLVGHASRILSLMIMKNNSHSSRFKHTCTACYILDTVLSMQLGCPAYFPGSDIEALGTIEENGIEEWAPWSSCMGRAPLSHHSTALTSQNRSPTLALSSFNHFRSLVSIMSPMRSSNPRSQEITYRLEAWRTSLPATFDYIKNGYSAVPATPSALLLLLAYNCYTATLNSPPPQSFESIIGLLRRARETIGFGALPAITLSFLDIYVATHTFQALDQASKLRFQNAREELTKTWQRLFVVKNLVHGGASAPVASLIRHSTRQSNVDMHTPESLLGPLHPMRIPANLNSATNVDFIRDSAVRTSPNTQFHPSYTSVAGQANLSSSQNLESFFDELASLDGVGGLENQPQFMQNLGFAPDADIAELLASDFGQFDALQSNFAQHGNTSQMPFP